MSATLDIPSLFDAPSDTLSAPTWFNQLRADSWQRYQDLPAPSRRDENWRFGSLKKANIDNFVPAEELELSADLRGEQLESAAARFVFSNDHLVFSQASDLPAGVICLPISQALEKHSDLLEEHFMQSEVKLGSAKYAALHGANISNGLFVYVPDGVEVSEPIEVFHWIGGENSAVFPHTLIVAGANAKVKVIDTFDSADGLPTLTIALNDLVAGTGAKLDYVAIQKVNRVSKFIQANATTVGKDARVKSFTLNLGAAWARNESYSSLIGEGAHSDMLSVNVPFGEQEYDQRTFQHHVSRGAYSDLLYKNSLYDKSKTVFAGLIFVDEGAHDTDAYQTCRNLFMSDEAEANSMPGLEINADQVKCSHGSTSSQVSEEEIFYLQARGINARSARQLIARGFSVEAIERLEDEAIETLLLAHVDAKFELEHVS